MANLRKAKNHQRSFFQHQIWLKNWKMILKWLAQTSASKGKIKIKPRNPKLICSVVSAREENLADGIVDIPLES